MGPASGSACPATAPAPAGPAATTGRPPKVARPAGASATVVPVLASSAPAVRASPGRLRGDRTSVPKKVEYEPSAPASEWPVPAGIHSLAHRDCRIHSIAGVMAIPGG